jgi:peptide-methionine (S)-S-oxide reductase
MGGTLPNPTYQDVCTGRTGHAEVVRIEFDPATVTYAEVLEVFFATHDPTTPDRQGNDKGPQYRSVIFYNNEEQRAEAARVIRELGEAEIWDDPIVTELRPAGAFYRAEDYHQEYFANNPQQPYCAVVVAPNVRKFREQFAAKLSRKAAG